MQLRAAEGYTQLVVHLLAHVPLAGPGNLADPRYAALVGSQLPAEERALLEHDATLIAAAWAGDPRLDALHALVELHHDLAAFRRTAERALADLRDDEVAAPGLLASLRELAIGELVHAALALLDARFAVMRIDFVDAALELAGQAMQPWLARLRPHVPELDDVPLELVFAMGPHGRALAGRILIGAPVTWNGLHPRDAALQAAHEALVRSCGIDDYVALERWALRELGERLAAAEPELRQAHARWLAGLDCSGLGP